MCVHNRIPTTIESDTQSHRFTSTQLNERPRWIMTVSIYSTPFIYGLCAITQSIVTHTHIHTYGLVTRIFQLNLELMIATAQHRIDFPAFITYNIRIYSTHSWWVSFLCARRSEFVCDFVCISSRRSRTQNHDLIMHIYTDLTRNLQSQKRMSPQKRGDRRVEESRENRWQTRWIEIDVVSWSVIFLNEN